MHRADRVDMSVVKGDQGKERGDEHQVQKRKKRESRVGCVEHREAERGEEYGERNSEPGGNSREHISAHHDLFGRALRNPHQDVEDKEQDRFRRKGESLTADLSGKKQESINGRDQKKSEQKAPEITLQGGCAARPGQFFSRRKAQSLQWISLDLFDEQDI